MGIAQSASKNISDEFSEMLSHLKKRQQLMEEALFHNFFDNPVSDDLLIEILSFVPDSDLILNCQLVCKRWKELIDGQTIWRRKCERENIKLPNLSHKLHVIPKHHYRYMYQYNNAKENLLINPCGEDSFTGWESLQNGGNGLAIEKPPCGCDSVPTEVGSESCFASSYGECSKFQVIDLYEKAYMKYLLRNNLVTIKVGEWYGTRFDCGCLYELKVALIDDSSKQVDDFTFEFRCEQWDGGHWLFVDHEFSNVSDVRYIHFEHMGRDTQFWAGHYGSKFTGGFIKLCLI